MLADLESLIPSACLAVGFVLLIRAILRTQNPQRRAAVKAREAAAEAADSRIMDVDSLAAAKAKQAARTKQASKPKPKPTA